MSFRHPTLVELREGPFNRHMRPSDADDSLIRTLVERIFAPRLPAPPLDVRLIRQLLNRAPQPDLIGVDDWARPLRADELAEVWGAPMEGPATRHGWLLRADEIARAWGRPLLGPGGLVDELGADAPTDLPSPPR